MPYTFGQLVQDHAKPFAQLLEEEKRRSRHCDNATPRFQDDAGPNVGSARQFGNDGSESKTAVLEQCPGRLDSHDFENQALDGDQREKEL